MTFYLTLLNQDVRFFKPKAYKRFTPTVFISDDALKFTKEAKYLGSHSMTLNVMIPICYDK